MVSHQDFVSLLAFYPTPFFWKIRPFPTRFCENCRKTRANISKYTCESFDPSTSTTEPVDLQTITTHIITKPPLEVFSVIIHRIFKKVVPILVKSLKYIQIEAISSLNMTFFHFCGLQGRSRPIIRYNNLPITWRYLWFYMDEIFGSLHFWGNWDENTLL